MLEKFVEEQLHVWKVPGIAVAVVKDDTVITMEGFGRRNDTDPVTPQTLFAIGSSTKAFTATSLGALVDEELLEWDTPVREYLPGFRMYDPVATERLTVRDMLSHRSGLPRHDWCWYDEQGFTRADIVARLRHLQPNKDLRQVWQYNNLLYDSTGLRRTGRQGGLRSCKAITRVDDRLRRTAQTVWERCPHMTHTPQVDDPQG